MSPAVTELARFIAHHGLAQTLLDQHAPGDDGRCPVCRIGGIHSPRVPAPCRIYVAALVAQRGGGRCVGLCPPARMTAERSVSRPSR